MAGPVRLREAWSRLIAALGGDERAAGGVWDELDTRYSEDARAYHTWSHIDHAHQVMEWILDRAVATRPPIELAVFFHDAIYSVMASPDTVLDNEAASAEFAKTACGLMALPEDLGAEVARLVLATRNHRPRDQQQAVLCDADLAVLASDPATYDLYRRAIRVEYSHVEDAAFRVGRATVLRGFLKRKQLYSTPVMHDRGESVARANLERELLLLE